MGALFSNRPRAIAVTLIAFLLGVGYLVIAVFNRPNRVAEATSQLSGRARSAADRLDAACKERADNLRSVASGYRLSDRLRSGDLPSIRLAVRELPGAVPDLICVAIHKPDGRQVAAYPSGPQPKGRGGSTSWFLDQLLQNQVYLTEATGTQSSSSRRFLAMAFPLGSENHPEGYLVGQFSTDFIARIIGSRSTSDVIGVSVQDRQGATVRDNLDHRENALAKTHRRGSPAVSDTSALRLSVPETARGPGLLVRAEMPESAVPRAAILLNAPLACIVLISFVALFIALWRLPGLYEGHQSMRETLTRQNRELKDLDHAKSEFLANVSHDLWTPLASLEMSLSGLLDPQIQWRPEQVREKLQLANYELSQLINRVRNLLEMARLNANADMGQKEPCDLTDSVGSALERLSPLLLDRQVLTDFPAYPLMFMCRHTQFEIVFMNLIENAIKYSAPASPLSIHGERRGTDIFVSVRDCGAGVDPKDVDLIFQQFYRADRSSSKSGSGLGLAICKSIVELHGGVIGVRNPPGGGAEFWLSVPAMAKDRLD